MNEQKLKERLNYWKLFMLDSNEKIHQSEKGVITAESLVMNNFIVDWFKDFEKDIITIFKDKTK